MALWKPIRPEAPYQTLALWQGTMVRDEDDVEDFFLNRCGSRIKRVGCVETSSGRIDFAFFVHDEDVPKFAIQRFVNMPGDSPRWWEDIYFNGQQDEFPENFLKFYPDVTS